MFIILLIKQTNGHDGTQHTDRTAHLMQTTLCEIKMKTYVIGTRVVERVEPMALVAAVLTNKLTCKIYISCLNSV